MNTIDRMVEFSPKLKRGRVWCLSCGATLDVKAAICIARGWPKCCGSTMSLDSPEERKALSKEVPDVQ